MDYPRWVAPFGATRKRGLAGTAAMGTVTELPARKQGVCSPTRLDSRTLEKLLKVLFLVRPGRIVARQPSRLLAYGLLLLGGLAGFVGAGQLLSNHAFAVTCPNPSQQLNYGYQNSTLAAYGVDGYVENGASTLGNPDCDKIVAWIGVAKQSDPNNNNIQTGSRIGYGSSGTQYSREIYVEKTDPCLGHTHTVFGAPPSWNYPYYVTYDGVAWNFGCGYGTSYEYAIRKGDWYSAPFLWGYLSVASPIWAAKAEYGTRDYSFDTTGIHKFGNPTSLPYGLSWYNQPVDTWNSWTSGATVGSTSPSIIVYCSQVAYRAFKVYGTGMSTCP